MKELHAIFYAYQWYRRHGEWQYTAGEIEKYDRAAQLLTKRAEFAEFLIKQVGENPGRTLEIAAGTGLVSRIFQKRIQDLVFTDISMPALDILRSRVGNQSTIVQADFFHLPFAQDSFRTVVSVGGYRYIPPESKRAFWDEMRRIIQDEGRIFISQFYPRGVSLKGNDIQVDRFLVDHNFSLNNIKQYESKINMKLANITSGIYRTFEFSLHK